MTGDVYEPWTWRDAAFAAAIVAFVVLAVAAMYADQLAKWAASVKGGGP